MTLKEYKEHIQKSIRRAKEDVEEALLEDNIYNANLHCEDIARWNKILTVIEVLEDD